MVASKRATLFLICLTLFVSCHLSSANPCQPNPCANGFCESSSNEDEFKCLCPEDFTGQLCDTEVTVTEDELIDSLALKEQPVAKNDTKNFGLTSQQFFGNPCGSAPCQYGGTCINIPAANVYPPFACVCPAGRTGIQCEILNYNGNGGNNIHTQNNCFSNPCHYGRCYPNAATGAYTCVCNPGYTGLTCNIPLSGGGGGIIITHPFTVSPITNACAQNNCLNGGTCVSSSFYEYQCVCHYGCTGNRCETITPSFNPCSSNPCNNGQCLPNQQTGAYTCLCNPGYTGLVCNQYIQQSTYHPFTTYYPHTTIINTVCNTNPCYNGGSCYPNAGSYTEFICTCPNGYIGTRCEQQIVHTTQPPVIVVDPCSSLPCLNGGHCSTNGYQGYVCTCLSGYYGNRCENVIQTTTPRPYNPCDRNPCINSGYCVPNLSQGTYYCVCTSSYYGTNCEYFITTTTTTTTTTTPANPCHSNPCYYGGTCVSGSNYFTYACICPPQYTGLNCETPVVFTTVATTTYRPNPCNSNPCYYGGTCVSSNDYVTYACVCPPLYTGFNCETAVVVTTVAPVNPCAINPCQNNGYCVPNTQYGTYYCVCQGNYFGSNCEQVQVTTVAPSNKLCSPNPCLNGGVCVVQSYNTFSCICPNYYEGPTCQFYINTTPAPANPCLPNPCLNGGNCVPLPPGTVGRQYACVCPPNYSGPICETPQQVTTVAPSQTCSPNPCQYGGTCIANQYNGFVCNCPPGYTGPTCTLILAHKFTGNPCASSPCQSGGICTVSWGASSGYKCTCMSGYIGERCEQQDLCANSYNTCFNGGTCITEIGTNQYTVVCRCAPGYSGSRCQMNANTHVDNDCSCRNSGLCQTDGTCFCLPNYYGAKCEFDFTAQVTTSAPVVNCPTGLCIHGSCQISFGNTFFCYCNIGWTGSRCDQRINVCQTSNPCLNGICTTNFETNSYTCACYTGFYGVNCESGGPGTTQVTAPITSNVCQSRVCYNGGSCFINKENQARCQCKRGYIGLSCETDICLQKQIVGTCRQSITRYWYDASRLSCQPFTFSGCNGNENNFEDLAGCNKQCSGHKRKNVQKEVGKEDP